MLRLSVYLTTPKHPLFGSRVSQRKRRISLSPRHVSTQALLLTRCSSLDCRMVRAGAAVSLLLILLTHMSCMTGAVWGSAHPPTPSVTAATKLEAALTWCPTTRAHHTHAQLDTAAFLLSSLLTSPVRRGYSCHAAASTACPASSLEAAEGG